MRHVHVVQTPTCANGQMIGATKRQGWAMMGTNDFAVKTEKPTEFDMFCLICLMHINDIHVTYKHIELNI
jgi:hypothetical protein